MNKRPAPKQASAHPSAQPTEEQHEALDIQAPQSFEAFCENSRTLRTWLVAYGIGGPILFASQQELAAKLGASPAKTAIVFLFLAGLAAQIAISLLNKWVNWAAYAMSLNPPVALAWRHKSIIWLANQFWIDIAADVLSVAVFVIATFMVLEIILT